MKLILFVLLLATCCFASLPGVWEQEDGSYLLIGDVDQDNLVLARYNFVGSEVFHQVLGTYDEPNKQLMLCLSWSGVNNDISAWSCQLEEPEVISCKHLEIGENSTQTEDVIFKKIQ